MLSNRNYRELTKDTGIYVVCEMDTEYHCRTERLIAANPTGDTYSVSKLFTVTAIGICADRGLLTPEDRFLDVMELELPEGCDEKWRQVTLDMLMRHRFGLARGLLDIDVERASLFPGDDYLSLVLATPLPGELGGERCYSDAAYYLLSLAVEKVSGMTLFDFLRDPLMRVMRFDEYAWSACPKGHTMGATGLYLRCEDVVKLGVLYLNEGRWQGETVVSANWCRTVLERGYELRPLTGGWYAKGGMYGQIIAIHPEQRLAVAWMGFSGKIDDVRILNG